MTPTSSIVLPLEAIRGQLVTGMRFGVVLLAPRRKASLLKKGSDVSLYFFTKTMKEKSSAQHNGACIVEVNTR